MYLNAIGLIEVGNLVQRCVIQCFQFNPKLRCLPGMRYGAEGEGTEGLILPLHQLDGVRALGNSI